MQSSHKPIAFTEKFFTLPPSNNEEIMAAQPVFVVPTSAETLKDFFLSADGAQYKQCFAGIVRRIIMFAQAQQMPFQPLMSFNLRHQAYEADDADENEIVFPFYSEALLLLHRFELLLKNDRIPLFARCEGLKNICDIMTRCAPHVHTALIQGCLRLEGYLDREKYLLHARRLLAEQYALKLMAPRNISKMFDVHYVNAILNEHYVQLGIPLMVDPYIDDTCDEDILDDLLDEFEEVIDDLLHPVTFIAHLMREFDADNIGMRCREGNYGSVITSIISMLDLSGSEGKKIFFDLRHITALDDEDKIINNWRAKNAIFQSIRQRLTVNKHLEKSFLSHKIESHEDVYNLSKEDDKSLYLAYVHTPNDKHEPEYHSLMNYLVERLLDVNDLNSPYVHFYFNVLTELQRVWIINLLCLACKMEGHTHPITSPAKIILTLFTPEMLAAHFDEVSDEALAFYTSLVSQHDDAMNLRFNQVMARSHKNKLIVSRLAKPQAEQLYLRYHQLAAQQEDYNKDTAEAFAYFAVDSELPQLLEQVISCDRLRLDLNSEDGVGYSILMSAVNKDNADMVKVILSHHINLNRFVRYGLPMLHATVLLNRYKLLRLLLQHGAELVVTRQTPFDEITYDAIEMVLVNKSFQSLEEILLFAIENNLKVLNAAQTALVTTYLSVAPPSLIAAIVNYFLKQGMLLPDAIKEILFDDMRVITNIALLRQLVMAYPQWIAAFVNHQQRPFFIRTPINLTNKELEKQIYQTIFSAYQEVCGKKLEISGYINYLIKEGKLALISKLMPDFFGVNEKLDASGATVLHLLAKSYPNQKLLFRDVSAFFKRFADLNINVQDDNGNTPLHYAGRIGNWLMTVILNSRNASKEIVNHQGETPMQFALAPVAPVLPVTSISTVVEGTSDAATGKRDANTTLSSGGKRLRSSTSVLTLFSPKPPDPPSPGAGAPGISNS